MNEDIEEIKEKQVAKHEAMYNRIEIEIQGLKQALQSSREASTVPLPEGTTKAGDELVQLHRIADTVEVHLQKEEEATTKATQALKKIIEKHQAAQQEKEAIQAKFDKDREKI
jgi:hypothetical protein